MRSTQITTWRRYTAAEKKAYRAREERRYEALLEGFGITRDEWERFVVESVLLRRHHFADNHGSRVPTMRVNEDVL